MSRWRTSSRTAPGRRRAAFTLQQTPPFGRVRGARAGVGRLHGEGNGIPMRIRFAACVAAGRGTRRVASGPRRALSLLLVSTLLLASGCVVAPARGVGVARGVGAPPGVAGACASRGSSAPPKSCASRRRGWISWPASTRARAPLPCTRWSWRSRIRPRAWRTTWAGTSTSAQSTSGANPRVSRASSSMSSACARRWARSSATRFRCT